MGGVYSDDVDGQWQDVGWILWSNGFVAFEVDLPENGVYTFRVRAWGSESGDGVEPSMTVSIDANELAMLRGPGDLSGFGVDDIGFV